MNGMVSSSNTPMAHPPRSNPFLRSSSDAPPFPCITPSTVTCVMVVSFMIAVPFSLGAPLVGGRSPLLRTPLSRSDTAPGFLSGTFWYAGGERSGSEAVSGRLRRILGLGNHVERDARMSDPFGLGDRGMQGGP